MHKYAIVLPAVSLIFIGCSKENEKASCNHNATITYKEHRTGIPYDFEQNNKNVILINKGVEPESGYSESYLKSKLINNRIIKISSESIDPSYNKVESGLKLDLNKMTFQSEKESLVIKKSEQLTEKHGADTYVSKYQPEPSAKEKMKSELNKELSASDIKLCSVSDIQFVLTNNKTSNKLNVEISTSVNIEITGKTLSKFKNINSTADKEIPADYHN